MKKNIILLMLLIISASSFSQQNIPSHSLTKTDYLQKSKNQKTGAWVLLGGGTVLIGTGFLIGDQKDASFGAAGAGVVLGGIGFLATIGSIPLFIASSKNKRRGMEASAYLKVEDVSIIHEYSKIHTFFPAFAVKINLR